MVTRGYTPSGPRLGRDRKSVEGTIRFDNGQTFAMTFRLLDSPQNGSLVGVGVLEWGGRPSAELEELAHAAMAYFREDHLEAIEKMLMDASAP